MIHLGLHSCHPAIIHLLHFFYIDILLARTCVTRPSIGLSDKTFSISAKITTLSRCECERVCVCVLSFIFCKASFPSHIFAGGHLATREELSAAFILPELNAHPPPHKTHTFKKKLFVVTEVFFLFILTALHFHHSSFTLETKLKRNKNDDFLSFSCPNFRRY